MQYPRDTVQSRIATALGDVRLAASAKGLVGLWFDGQRHQPAQLDAAPAWPTDDAHPVLRGAAQQLQQFLRGERTRFDLPLDLSGGTPFQQAVWQALLAVPHGATTSYGALARQIGRPTAVRAVGAAVAGAVAGGAGAHSPLASNSPPPSCALRLRTRAAPSRHSPWVSNCSIGKRC